MSGKALKGDEIIRLVDAQDAVAELALSRYELRLAKALSHVVNILDPDVIVLGGGMSNVERLYKTVPSLMKSLFLAASARRRYVRRGMAIQAACAARPGCGRWRNVFSRMVSSGNRRDRWLLVF